MKEKKCIFSLTNSFVELHANDRMFVSLIVPGAVAELRDPAFGFSVGGAGEHHSVIDVHADDGRAVCTDALEKNGIFYAPLHFSLALYTDGWN